MRKLVLTALAASMTALLGSSAAAQAPAGDSVTGGASLSQPGPPEFHIAFGFDAHSGPSGENPTGSAQASVRTPFGDFLFGGPVTCLYVSGSAATIGTFADRRTSFFFVGPSFVGFGAFESTTAPTVCPAGFGGQPFSQLFEPRAMDEHFIEIVDAPALPTAKDQCKKGGWRSYGVFKSQGDCVSGVRQQVSP
jgi:hypothetical protein